MMFLRVLFFIIVLISLCMPMQSRADEPLVWGFSQFMPFIYANAAGQPAGPFAEKVMSTFAHANIDIQGLYTPKRRANRIINQGIIDFSTGAMEALDNPDDFYISRTAMQKIDLRFYWLGEKKPVTGAADLQDESVILITAFQYGGLRDFIENPINKVVLAADVEDHQRALSALLLNRGDYLLGYHTPINSIKSELNVQSLHSHSIQQIEIFFFIHRSVKNGQQLMDRLEVAHAELYGSN
jgi:polar amino acid transport system substrate-binding protein